MATYTIKIDDVDVTANLYEANFTVKLNDDLDEGQNIIIKNNRKDAYESNLKVDITIDDGVATENHFFIVSSDISTQVDVEEVGINTLYEHNISIIELTYWFAEITELDVRPFTQPLTGTKFTIYDVVKDIQNTIPIRFTGEENAGALFIIDGDAINPASRTGLSRRMTDVISPDFVLESSNLKELLDTVIGYLKAIPRLVRSGGLIILTADFVNELGNEVDFEVKTTNREERMNINQYATSLEFELSNVRFDVPDSNTVYEPASTTGYKRLTSRTPGTYTDQTAIIPSNQGLVTVKKCVLPIEVTTPPLGVVDVDITDFIYEFSVYDNLPTSAIVIQENTKQVALYYDLNKKDIKGLYIDFGLTQGVPINNVITFAVANQFGIAPGPGDITFPKFYELEFRLEYEPIFSMRGRTHRVDKSRINVNTQRIANQNDRALSFGRAVSEMNGKLQQMGNPVISTNQRVKLLSEAFNIGDFSSSNYVCTIKDYTLNRDDILIKYAWAQGYQKLTGFASLNAEKRVYDVSESSFKRNVYYEEFIEFSETNRASTSQLSSAGESTFYNILRQSPSNANDDPIRAVLFNNLDAGQLAGNPNSKTFNPLTERLVFPIIPSAGEDCINFYWEIDDPVVAGNQVGLIENFILPDKPILVAVGYTNSDGTVTNYSSAYITKYDIDDSGLLPVVPIAGIGSGTFLINPNENKFIVELDLAGKLAETRSLQVYSEVLNKFVIGKYLLENNNLIRLYNGSYPSVKIVKGNELYNNNSKEFANDDSVDANVNWTVVNGVIQLSTPITNANAWAIVVSSTNQLILGVNQAPKDNPTFPILGISTINVNFLRFEGGINNEI